MESTRFRRLKDCLLSPREFEEIQHAFCMTVLALVPATLMFCVFQFSVTSDAVALMRRIDRSAITGHDLTPLFNYYTSWVAHVLISLSVSLAAARNAFRDTTPPKIAVMKRFRLMSFLVALAFVLLADAGRTKLALLTHQRLFAVLSAETSLSPLFRQDIGPLWRPTWFSFFVVSGIAVALWATTTIVLCVSKFLAEFQRPDSDARPSDRIAVFTDALEALRSHFLALSLVLVTSTLGTIAYLRIPLGLLGADERRNFKLVSDAIGLIWGVTFSLTLLFLCIYPFIVLRKRFNALERDSHGSKGESLRRWLRKNQDLLHVPANLQIVLSVLSPAAVAVFANLMSN